MKHKIVMAVCMLSCIGMLAGCGKEESMEPAKETMAVMDDVESADEGLEPESKPTTSAIGTATDNEESSVVDNAGDVKDSEGENEPVTACTLEQLLEDVENEQTIYAIKKGDVFYKLENDAPYAEDGRRPGYETVFCEDDDLRLIIRDADEATSSIEYAQGDAFVIFSTILIQPCFLKIEDTPEHYCIPAQFSYWENGSISLPYIKATNSYVDGDEDFRKFDEYDGTIIKGEKIIGGETRCLVEGAKDEILEFGGYQGTQYKSVRYKCTGRYYEVRSSIDCSRSYEMTKEGYAIVSSAQTNPLEDGIYIIGSYMVEIKN